MKTCHACGEPWEGSVGSQPAQNETCAKCDADLHVCLNCRHHDVSATNECKSRTAEPVKDKERHNMCDEFLFASRDPGRGETPFETSKGDMEKKWKELFG
jgi:hypothetical protein